MMGEARVEELLAVCSIRIENLRSVYASFIPSVSTVFNKEEFLRHIAGSERHSSDNKEYMFFAGFIRKEGMCDFDILKERYLLQKREYLKPYVGQKLFIEDYYKVLENIYLAVTDVNQFYKDFNIRDRYDLLWALYNMDTQSDDNNLNVIPIEQLEKRIKSVKNAANWSRLFLIDECQDFHLLEKELLFHLRGDSNFVVATGGVDQLIRRNSLLNWTVSLGKKVAHLPFKLKDVSYRQKQNIINFVNAFGSEFGLPVNLTSIPEQQGLGKVVIDLRPRDSFFINPEIASELKLNGELSGCSPYESVIFLIPSRNYTLKNQKKGIVINDTDVISQTSESTERRTSNLETLNELGYFCWDGVTEQKSKLKVPHQTDTRILHYESCRGLEAWSVALMSLDEFFLFKSSTDDAALHLADDLYLSENDRREKFAALWCLMAFTRPIDTLYIHIENRLSLFAKRLITIAEKSSGVVIME